VRNPRLTLVGAAAGALAMGAAFAVPAAASTVALPPCPTAGERPGVNCAVHNEDLVNVRVNVGVPDIHARVTVPPVGAHVGVNLGRCDNLLSLLVRARTNEGSTHRQLVLDEQASRDAHVALAAAQTKDNSAKATRDAAISAVQNAYTAWIAANPNASADQKAIALAARNKAIAAANSNYDSGGTAAALTAAQAKANAADLKLRRDRAEEQNLLVLVVKLGNDYKACQTPTTIPTTVVTPPPPVVVTEVPPPVVIDQPPVVVSPPQVIIQNPQVGIVPSGPAPTGAMTQDDRYTS
jgi:hypothetical protein